MAPPKWSVFDGLEEGEEDDNGKTGEQEGSAGGAAGAEEHYVASEADSADSGSQDSENQENQENQEDQDPGEGDGDKPDKKELFICAGAMCTCTQAVSPAPIKLNVVTQQRYTINDPDGSQKLIATDKEQDITALNFVSCKFPDPSKPRPCNPKLLWKDFYKPVVLPGGAHPLTEKSTAFCTVGTGTVEVKITGQQSMVTPAEVAAANSGQWQSENPLTDESAADVQLEEDADENDEKGVGVRAIKAKTAGPYPVGATIIFEATKLTKPLKQCTAAELRGINWMVYDRKLLPCGHAVDAGVETAITFRKAGTFTVEGYGGMPGANNAKSSTRKGSALAQITIEENRLAGIKRVSGSGGTEYRFSEPAVYELSTLFPVASVPLPRRQSLEAVVWTLVKKGGAGEPVLVPAGGSATVTCTGPCDYVVIAALGQTAQQSPLMKAIANRVIGVTASVKNCRPGEEVVLKAVFKIEPALPAERALLKWQCKDEKGAEHPGAVLNGQAEQHSKLAHEGHYKVWAFVHSPSKNAMAEFDVMQPRIKLVEWVYPDGKTPKKVTGWDEENRVKMVFESAQGLEAETIVGVVREGAFHPIMQPTRFKIDADGHTHLHFPLLKASFRDKIKEGDFLSVQVRCVTPGQSIAGGEVRMLRFTEKEGLGGIVFFKGGERVNQAQYGDTLRCRVYGRNLSAGKNGVAVKIYRIESRLGMDALRIDTEMGSSEKVVIGEHGYGEFDFTLDSGKAADYEEMVHQFYAWVEENEWFGAQEVEVHKSEAGGVLLFVQLPLKEGEGKVSKVGVEKGEGEEGEENGCPNCNEDITVEQLKKIFPDCKDEDRLKESAAAYNEFMKNFSMNTCWNKAHFFAQTRIEAGTSFNIKNEGFNYSVKRLQKGDYTEGKVWVKGDAKTKTGGYFTDGKYGSRPFAYFDKHQSEADLYGRKDLNHYNDKGIQAADPEKIANLAYGPNSAMGKQLGNTQEGDGWQFKGRGFIQLTGRYNYTQSNIYTKLYATTEIISKEGAAKVAEPRVAMIACMGHWKLKGLDKVSNGTKNEDKISKKIGTDVDWKGKQKAFTDVTSALFKVDECKLGEKEPAPADNPDGVLNTMKKLADKHYSYSQLGDRTSNTEEGMKEMDCSEFVSRYLYELGVTSSVKDIHTGIMTTEADFRNAIGSTNIDLVIGSTSIGFIPQRGDIFVWRNKGIGHTGVVYSVDSNEDTVTILEAIGSIGAVGESKQVKNGGYSGRGCSRTAIYNRAEGALATHGGWKGYFRPKNYTKKL